MLHLIPAIMLILLLTANPAFAESPIFFDNTDDWSHIGDKARQIDLPILAIFVADECTYCKLLEKEVIQPKLKDGLYEGRFIVQVFDINTWKKIIDFDGTRVRGSLFAKRYGVFVTPTTLLLNHQGETLAKPIVGYRSQGNFKQRLDKAVAESYISLLTSPETLKP